MFIRQGICNRCGECCGYPRAGDGNQVEPFPGSWPEVLRAWSPESIAAHLPILQFADNMVNTPNGNFIIQGHRCYWIWVHSHGLCTDMPPYGDTSAYDQRCPCLGDLQPDNTVPCRLVGTRYESVWIAMCEPSPPYKFETAEEVALWHQTCPSCSYIYMEE